MPPSRLFNEALPPMPVFSGVRGADVLRLLAKASPLWDLGDEGGLASRQLDHLEADPARFEVFFPVIAGARFLLWRRDPLDPAAVSRLAALEARRPFLPQAAKALLMAVAKRLAVPEDQSLWEAVTGSGDLDLAREFIATVAKDPVHGPYWLGRTFRVLCALPDPEKAAAILADRALDGLAPVRERLRDRLAFLHEPPRAALDRLARSPGAIWGHDVRQCAAVLLDRLGEPEAAATLLMELRRAMPWRVGLTLTLFERLFPTPLADASQSGKAAVLVYSMNKAAVLRETLENLARTDLCGCPVVVLDNGSSDETPALLREAAAWFPENRFQTVTLPVNVGAPAARNWLLSLPDVRSCDSAVFLDDDALPPEDWLRRLLGAAKAHPEAGAVGCAIVDAAPPHFMQTADVELLPPAFGQRDGGLFDERIALFDPSQHREDEGLFAYSRPCLSVSGCCHLLSMRAVRAAGPFNVGFNPTQFDDLERDMRSTLAGFPTRFLGTLKTRHMQFSSMRQPESAAKLSHILGNRIKLESLFSDGDIARLCDETHAALWRDLLEKADALDGQDVPETRPI